MGIDPLMRRAAFLDRDGVLNQHYVRGSTTHPPNSVAEVELMLGVQQATAALARAGLLLIVVTNQPDVARGTQTRAAVDAINEHIRASLQLDAVFTCAHDTPDNCACRKPKPGLLLRAAEQYDIDLAHSFLVGDRWSDIAAGAAAGCTTVLIRNAHSQQQRCNPDYVVNDVLEAAHVITHHNA